MHSSVGTLSPYPSDDDETAPIQLRDEQSPSEAYHFSLFSKYWASPSTPKPPPQPMAADWSYEFTKAQPVVRVQHEPLQLFVSVLLVVLPDCPGRPVQLTDKDWAQTNSLVFNHELPISLECSEYWDATDIRHAAIETAMQRVSRLVVYGRDLSHHRPDVQHLKRLVWRTTLQTQFRSLPPK